MILLIVQLLQTGCLRSFDTFVLKLYFNYYFRYVINVNDIIFSISFGLVSCKWNSLGKI